MQIVLLNLMPTKQATERQFRRLLSSTVRRFDLILMTTETYRPVHTESDHIDTFYATLRQLRGDSFDGLIITGAPVEKLPFEEVKYWHELLDIFSWAKSCVERRLYICWAAQAALYATYGINKTPLAKKLFGVYPQRVLRPDAPLLRGFPSSFPTPVSRHTAVDRAVIETEPSLEIIAAAEEGEVCLVRSRDNADTYMLNHLEYDTGTLAAEFERDRARGSPIEIPANYFPDDDPGRPPINCWHGFAQRLFENWLTPEPAHGDLGERIRTPETRIPL